MLHLSDSGAGTQSSILLGRGNGISSGIRVDRVIDVVDLPQSVLQSPPATLPEHMRALVLGVLRFAERPVAVLDIDRMFGDYANGLG